MTEHEEPHERYGEDAERLRRNIERRIKGFEVLGGRAGVVITEESPQDHWESARPLVRHGETETFFAASTNKLAIAYVLSQESPQALPRLYQVDRRLVGAGEYDVADLNEQPGPELAEDTQLVADMLKRSGNTAASVLKEALGPRHINEVLRSRGYPGLRLGIDPKTGASHLGFATPEAMVRLMDALIDGHKAPNPIVGGTIIAALNHNQRPAGIRAALTQPADQLAARRTYVYNKTGEYNGDEEVGAPVRHDVGCIGTADTRTIYYAVMSQARAPVMAEYFLHNSMADILEYAGEPSVRAGRKLAGKALNRLGISRHP